MDLTVENMLGLLRAKNGSKLQARLDILTLIIRDMELKLYKEATKPMMDESSGPVLQAAAENILSHIDVKRTEWDDKKKKISDAIRKRGLTRLTVLEDAGKQLVEVVALVGNAFGDNLALVLANIPNIGKLWQHPDPRSRVMMFLLEFFRVQWEENCGAKRSLDRPQYPVGKRHRRDSNDDGVEASSRNAVTPSVAQDSVSNVSRPSNVTFDFEQQRRRSLVDKEPEYLGKPTRPPNHMARILHPEPELSSPAAGMLSVVANSPNTANVAHSNPLHTRCADRPGCMSEDRGSTEQQGASVVRNLDDTKSEKPHLQHDIANQSRANDDLLETNSLLSRTLFSVDTHPLVTLYWSGYSKVHQPKIQPWATYLFQTDFGLGTDDRMIVYQCNAFWCMQWLNKNTMDKGDRAICYHDLERSKIDNLGFPQLSCSIQRSYMWRHETAKDHTKCFRFFIPDSKNPSLENYGSNCVFACIVPKSDAPSLDNFALS
jgi:hypothetical protein